MDLTKLWIAANTHSINMVEEFLSDGKRDDVTGVPPMPDDANEVIRLIVNYLESTV